MHLHLPKPLHGWRAFAGEVGIIVIGVLIALGAEQLVEDARWKIQTRETERALRDEIQESVDSVAERQALDGCLRQQLIALRDEALGSANEAKSAVPVDASRVMPDAYASPWRAWARGSWESAIASGALNHVKPNRLAAYSGVYKAVEDADGIVRQERLTKGALAPLALGKPTATTAPALLTAVANLDRNRADMLVVARDLLKAAGQLGIKAKPGSLVADFKRRYPICR